MLIGCLLLLVITTSLVKADDDFVIVEATPTGRGLPPNKNEGTVRAFADGSCRTTDNKAGYCMTVNECHPLLKIFNTPLEHSADLGSVDTCIGRVKGVCCESKSKQTIHPITHHEIVEARGRSKRETKCKLTTDQKQRIHSSQCRRNNIDRSHRIVNGVEADPHEFKFVAALLNHGRQFCGGSLIDEYHVLTAAHCVAHMSKYDVQNLVVALGAHDISSKSSKSKHKVKRVIRHKGFSSSTLHNDIAILTLASPAPIGSNPNVKQVYLPSNHELFVDQEAIVAGWGTLSEGGPQSKLLRKVTVKIWTNARCKNSYGSSAPGGITSGMMCASEREKDSCSGDSGGPLFTCTDRDACTQIGIVSWGIGCAQAKYPGVYTRVTEMDKWIQKITSCY